MVEGEGELLLRGGDEPALLESPTTISGVNDGGAISDGTFVTPDISFEREVTSGGATANIVITASFSEVSPGSVTGSINDAGRVELTMDLNVDLAVYVDLFDDTFECRAGPISLDLRSVAPYDETGEGSVVLTDGNFTVPDVPIDSECVELVADGINAELGGSGHSLTLPLTGRITPPAFPGYPTTTALTVAPIASTQGDPVTFTATVAAVSGGGGTGVPTGTVDFADDGRVIGSAPLSPEGVATFTTSDLPAGTRDLTATYTGVPEVWDDSASTEVQHRVAATPLLSADIPAAVQVGGDPVDVTTTITNTGFGDALEDLRYEVTLQRSSGSDPIGPDGSTPRLVLSRVVDGVATPIPMVSSGGAGVPEFLDGTIIDAGAWTLAAGVERVETLRLQVSDATSPGPLQVTLRLVRPGIGGGVDTTVGETVGTLDMLGASRQETTITAGDDFFFPAVTPVATRQGSVVDITSLFVSPIVGGRGANGYLEFFIDGVPALSRQEGASSSLPFSPRSPVENGGGASYVLQVASTTPIGTRQITARYSGDAYFAPSVASWPVRIEPAVGATYECVWSGVVSNLRTLFNIQAQANLPAVWPAGTSASFTNMHVRMIAARNVTGQTYLPDLYGPGSYEREFSFGVGPEGTATAETAVGENGWAMLFEDGLSIDHTITFGGVTGSTVIDGAPGDVVDVTLDSIDAHIVGGGGLEIVQDMNCTPVGEPIVLDQVVAAGAALVVSPGGPVAAGDEVTLTASALPAGPGTVEFRDGATTVGVAATTDGVATVVTDDLAPGLRSLTAIFRGSAFGPVMVWEPVGLRGVGECRGQVDLGNGAAVRLVYLELLGRCPDQVGYDYWTQALDDQRMTREQFALRISASLEAREVIVDDAYQTMLGRRAEPEGRRFWAQRLAGDTGYDDLLAALATAGGEFDELAGGTATGFVTRVYERVLGRAPEASGLAFWRSYLARHGERRLVLALVAQAEPRAAVVTDAYQDILDRAPSAEELAAGSALFGQDMDRSRLYASLIGTDELFTRAQEFPAP